MRFVLALLALIVLTARPAQAADDPVLAAASDLSGLFMFLESEASGMVLVVARGENVIIRGYGETEKGSGKSPDGDSLFRLNSVTKVFATETLASLAADRKLALTDPLQNYADAQVPAFEGRPITLLDLATHSAALPREMADLPDGANPRAWPTFADRWAWLPGYRLPWAPGSITSYSNVGFDFLADAIAKAGGQSYAEVLKGRVTGPLGMADTGLSPTPEQCARLMVGSGLAAPVACVDTQATGGSGGLYSTGNDMARWLRHNLEPGNPTLALSHAVYRQRQSMPAAIGFDEAGPMAGLGLGWVAVAADGIQPMLIGKTGGGAGFMCYVVFAPGHRVGLFVLVSRVDIGMFSALTDAANKLIASLVTR